MSPPSDLHTLILTHEQSTWTALQSPSGAALLPYITPDCIMCFPMGLKLTATSQPSVTEILYSPAFVPWKSWELENVDVVSVGGDGAVISYVVRAKREGSGKREGMSEGGRGGEDVETKMLCSSAWRREGEGEGKEGGWKMCFHQQALAE